jgi:hypothetical protein
VPEVTTHSFPKTVATLIDDEGMTQDRYMSRGRIHTQVADLLARSR